MCQCQHHAHYTDTREGCRMKKLKTLLKHLDFLTKIEVITMHGEEEEVMYSGYASDCPYTLIELPLDGDDSIYVNNDDGKPYLGIYVKKQKENYSMRKKEIALLASAAAVAYSLTLLLQAPFQACSGTVAGYYAAGAPETGIKRGKINETVMPGTPSPACPPTMTTSYTIEATTVANDEADTAPSSIAEGEVSREKEEEEAALLEKQNQKCKDDTCVTVMPGTPSPANFAPLEEVSYDTSAIPETYWNNDWAFQDDQQQVSPAEPPKPTTEASTEPSKETEKETETPREKETVPPITEAPKETVPSTEASTTAPKNDKPSGGGNHNDRPVPIPTPTVSHPTTPSPSEPSMENKVAATEAVTGNDQAHIHVNSRASASNVETSRATKTDDTSQMNRNAVAALILLSAFVCYLAYLKSCPRD